MARSLGEVARVSLGLGRRAAGAAERLSRSSLAAAYPQNARFKDLHLGRPAFVVGNGPSLATQDLSALEGQLLFTMNSFDRHPLCGLLRPRYHFLGDPEIKDSSPKQEAYLQRIAAGMEESVFFVPAEPLSDSPTLHRWHADGRMFPVPMIGALAMEPVDVFDMCVGLPGVHTSAQLALMAAVFMGCEPIYLTGLDSDWAASFDRDRHFYGERELDESWDWAYEPILEETYYMFRGYRHLWDYCKGRGVHIYNCTAGGFLDVFPLKSLDEAIGEVRGK
ncbi:MAG: hypothetical protein WCN81_04330 [Actinomycetes bacterium]